jgi:hypothetical protein
MSSKIKWLGVAALTAGLALSGTTAALAGQTPSPSPSPTQLTPSPDHHNRPVLRPEHFDIALDNIGTTNLDDVEATGPVHIVGGTDTTINNFLDRFKDAAGNTVNVIHTPLPLPVLNARTCSATFDQTGIWRFVGGTGLYVGETGRGQFVLQGLVSLNTDQWGRCPLAHMTPWQVLRDVESAHPNLSASMIDFNVQAGGVASVPAQPRINHFAQPAGSPTA